MGKINAVMARQRMIIGCCCNVDTLLHSSPVQQQVTTVTPACFTFLQPLLPPMQATPVDGVVRVIIVLPFVSILCF